MTPMNIHTPTAEDYSFEPVGTAEPSAPVVEAVQASQPPDSYYQDEEAEAPSDAAIMVGCGVLGWMVAGPCLAIVTALGGKYVADRNQGPIGDTTRAVGRIASAAGKKAKEEQLWSKLKAAVTSFFAKKEQRKTGSTNQGCTSKA